MNDKMYHIAMTKEYIEGARYAIIAGDPARIPIIADKLADSRPIAFNREYCSYLGGINGKKVVVMSHGIGGPSTAIAIEELVRLGIDTIIRVGTSGGIALDVKAGDAVVVTAAIRAEGTSREYLPIEFPAVADLNVTLALREAARELGTGFHVGIVQCKDSFYGQHDPDRMPVSYELKAKWHAWQKGGALASEMESAALFTVCSTLGIRAGAIMLCVWNRDREAAGMPQNESHDTEMVINVAINAIKRLVENDG